MMSLREDLFKTIRALPLAEQQALLSELTAALNHTMHSMKKRVPVPVGEVRGIAKPHGQPPTDEEIADGYADYLIKKYS